MFFSEDEPDPVMQSRKTAWLKWEAFPCILDLAKFLASQTEWGCIINADIVVHPRMKELESRLVKKRAMAASSWRFQFEPGDPNYLSNGRQVDNGLDFFAATPLVWRMVYNQAHPDLRLGACVWDTWMLSFFNQVAAHGFYDLTPHRVIFHPRHDGRKYGQGPDHTKIEIKCGPVMPYVTV